jgi:D-cysteine desulfhydrase family pyridoxal phosphate-dependent enzyme
VAELFDTLPREKLAFLPTPLHRLKNLGNSIGLDELWIKRDDQTGLSLGGNKARKLEFVLGDARKNRADTIVTVGGVQSNHCRQTAAACAIAGLRCILLLGGKEPPNYTGNLLLDKLLGAELKFYPDESLLTLKTRLDEVVETLKDLGLNPYAVPAGAEMPVGTISYAIAMEELQVQTQKEGFLPDRILVATGTGGTLAGLIIGAHMLDLDVEIVGVSVLSDAETTRDRVSNLIARVIDDYPEVGSFKPSVLVDDTYIGEGYGVLSDGVRTSLEMFAKMDGIILDPVYTGKAGLALLKMALNGNIPQGSPTVFWHTGGQPAIYAYPELGHK